jgi:hypothetical protein
LYAIQNGYELTELHGVQCPSPATNDVLKYDGSLWINSALTKSDVGLDNVDNTSDANKPISTATQTALDTKISTAKSLLTGSHQNATVTANGTAFNGFVTGGHVTLANEFQRRNLLPVACTLSNFTINLGACSGTGTVVVTLRKNGVDSAVVITIACPTVTGFFSAGGTLSCVANDIISYKIQNNTAVSTGALVLSSIVVQI